MPTLRTRGKPAVGLTAVSAGYSCIAGNCTGFQRTPGGDLTSFAAPGAGTQAGQGTFGWNVNPTGLIAGTYIDGNSVSHGFLRVPDGTIATFDVPGAGTGAKPRHLYGKLRRPQRGGGRGGFGTWMPTA